MKRIAFFYLPPQSLFCTALILFFAFQIKAQTGEYQGYRLHLVGIEKVKTSKSNTKFRCALTNTGRETVTLGKYRTAKDTLPLIEFDTTLEQSNLQAQTDQIRYSVLSQQNYVIKAGETVKDISIQINNSLPQPPKPIVKDSIVIKDTLTMKIVESKPKTDSVFIKKDTVAAYPIPKISVDTIRRPPTLATNPALQKDTTIVPKISVDTIGRSNMIVRNVPRKDTVAINKPSVIASPSPPEGGEPPSSRINKPNKEVQNSPPSGGLGGAMMAIDSCADLVIDGVRVNKLTEKYIWVEFNVFNKGTGSVALYGKGLKKEQYVAIHFYFSGTPRLSRGSVFADGIFITDGLKDTKGVLAPKTGVKQLVKISLEKLTRFNKVLLLQIDGFDTIIECDETNNGNYIIPNW